MTNIPLFLPPTPIRVLNRYSFTTSQKPTRPKMSTKGFGKAPPPRPPSSNQQRRDRASRQYDEMAASGMPEYTIWMRLKTGGTLSTSTDSKDVSEDEQMPWLPVGCIAVPRSGSVAKALKEAKGDLWQGAERLYPKLKGEDRDNVEFGCQLRQFPDEEIRLVEEGEDAGVGGWMKRFWGKLQNPLNVG